MASALRSSTHTETDEARRTFLFGGAGASLVIVTPTCKRELSKIHNIQDANLTPEQLDLIQYLSEYNAESGYGLFDLLKSLSDDSIWKFVNDTQQEIKQGRGTIDATTLYHTILDMHDPIQFAMQYGDADLTLFNSKNPEFRDILEYLFGGLSNEQAEVISKFENLDNIRNKLRLEITDLLQLIINTLENAPLKTKTGRKLQELLFDILNDACNSDETEDYRDWLRLNGKTDALKKFRRFVLQMKIKHDANLMKEKLRSVGETTIKISPNAIFTASYPAARRFVRSQIGSGAKSVTLLSPNYSKTISFPAGKYREFMQEFQKAGKESSGFIKVVISK